MSESSTRLPQLQPSLFPLEESIAKLELFPAVWMAAEQLTAPESGSRREAIEKLQELNAPRFSPLVAYLVATRLTDPDNVVRRRAIRVLGEVLQADKQGEPAPDNVRHNLTAYLSHMRTRHAFALIQVLVEEPSLEDHIARLLNACPYAGNHLADILADRKSPIAIREKAARMIGRVGYMDALSALEQLLARIEARVNGQRTMAFAPPSIAEEEILLPAIRFALASLRAP